MTSIRVAHAGADYDVIVGDLGGALPKLAELAKGVRLPVITDRRVYDLHGARLAGLMLPDPVLVPEGEVAKSWDTLGHVVEQLAGLGIRRGTPVIALGGGSVGDVAGLAASLFKRGCPVVHIPTTLLAQADSAVGGKTAIDAAGQKNLAGTFHHPLLVIADPALLDTLDERQMRSGYAEVVKYGLIDDADFFAWCEANGQKILGGDRNARCIAIAHCVRTKARFVAADPNDTKNTRALLNLGHTFGHAIEGLAGHALLHGEAVAVGMTLAFQYSASLGHCPAEDGWRVQAHLDTIGLPTTLAAVGLGGRQEDLLAAMAHDKKADVAGLALILVRGIGQAFVQHAVDHASLATFLHKTG